MARLNKSVVAGGVVYPAGSTGTDELRGIIRNPAHWDLEPGDEGYEGAVIDRDALLAVDPETADIGEFLAAAGFADERVADFASTARLHLGDGTQKVVIEGFNPVDVDIDELFQGLSVPEERVSGWVASKSADAGSSQNYDAMSGSELKAEIEKRNADRDEAQKIKPEGRRNDDLVAALRADDEA